ncbi:hypothetical protein BDR26DRAFT_69008 [Obelidium mucronatum]|nr:hypothetical protein BDR26DRAFT_69008 [Obelidium mucronatum]
MTIVRPQKFFRSSIGDLTPNNVGQLKVILERELPAGSVSDVEVFCKEAVAAEDLSRLAYFNDVPVGAVVCIKSVDAKDQPAKAQKNAVPIHSLSIAALVVLKQYRNLGLETLLLESVFGEIANEKTKAIHVLPGLETSEFERSGFEAKEGVFIRST